MHSREMVQLAALVAQHAPELVDQRPSLSPTGIELYWSASKCRLDRWGRTLKRQLVADSPPPPRSPLLRAVIEEILTGEILTRVWAAICAAHDHRYLQRDAEPVARSVLIGHFEARNRVLSLLSCAEQTGPEEAARLNAIRLWSEHWTNILIGYLTCFFDVSDFAFDPECARRISHDLQPTLQTKSNTRWQLLLAPLHAGSPSPSTCATANHDLNAQIAGGILACFPPEIFDATGVARAAWQARLFAVADDTQGLIENLFTTDWPEYAAMAGLDRPGKLPAQRARFDR